jgi:HAD superfamily hydrolase (TIGR01484 family)
MRPLCAWPLEERRRLIGVFTDIDDTLTTDGAITPDALQALGDLKAAGLHVIPITGRPIGWSEPFARGNASLGITPWPVDAIVAENGAVAFAWQTGARPVITPGEKTDYLCQIGLNRLLNKHQQLSKIYQQATDKRASNYTKMQAVAAQVMLEVPHARLSQDSPGRETDIAFDHSEFAHLPASDIARVVTLMHAAGMTATVSSIHINGWFGSHNKLLGARWIVRELWGRNLDTELDQWAYVGDSTNDQVMFEHFEHGIGVANIRRFEAALTHKPRYITPGERGAGFAQAAQAILQARAA